MAEDRVTRMQRRICEIVQQEIQGWINDLMRDMLDPSKIMAFAGAMGIEMSQLCGMMGKQPGFDPYPILGLDRSARDEEVKKRYRELLRKLHPDTAGMEGTAFLLQMVLAAYEMIRRERGWQ